MVPGGDDGGGGVTPFGRSPEGRAEPRPEASPEFRPAAGPEPEPPGPRGALPGPGAAGRPGSAPEPDLDLAVLDEIEQELADVERALAMLDAGTYGRCEVCGNGLDDSQLERSPAARFCPDHLPLPLP